MKTKTVPSSGFTLIELLLYVAISILMIVALVGFGQNLVINRVRARTQQEVNQNLRLVAERVSFEIRNAVSINSVSASSISLNATDSARSPTVIDLNSGRIRLGSGSSGSCTSSSPCNLTSNLVTVTNLAFTNMSSASASQHIRFTYTLANSTGRAEYTYNQTYTGSAELRSNPNYVAP